MATTEKVVILDTPMDLKSWLFVVRMMAEGSDVWRFIDPELSSPPQVPSRPTKPTVQMIKESLVTLNVEDRTIQVDVGRLQGGYGTHFNGYLTNRDIGLLKTTSTSSKTPPRFTPC
jgi:hypothetical protein